METYTAAQYERVLNDSTTEALIATQRLLPCESVAVELERRGVTLWHHSLRRAN